MIHRAERNETYVFELRKRGKLSSKFIGPFEILIRAEEVAYELVLAPSLTKFCYAFHVSQLRKYIYDPSHVLIHESLQIDEPYPMRRCLLGYWIPESRN